MRGGLAVRGRGELGRVAGWTKGRRYRMHPLRGLPIAHGTAQQPRPASSRQVEPFRKLRECSAAPPSTMRAAAPRTRCPQAGTPLSSTATDNAPQGYESLLARAAGR
jgi:hypothetical protein